MQIRKKELARMIDSTLVKPTVTKSEIERLCLEAIKYGCISVCINPIYVKFASSLLMGSDVKVCSTVGFPFGVMLTEIKALEAIKAVENGAKELDMVINVGLLKSLEYEAAKKDIVAVTNVKQRFKEKIIVKVIIETVHLTTKEKIIACNLVKEGGADFVKTSTGFFGKGATVEDVRLLRETVGEEFGVKAAGGIRSYSDALAMIKAGANRIGTSTAAEIIKMAT